MFPWWPYWVLLRLTAYHHGLTSSLIFAVAHSLEEKECTLNLKAFLFRTCYGLCPSNAMVFYLCILMSWKPFMLPIKYLNVTKFFFFFHFWTKLHVLHPSAINFWDLEIPNSDHRIKYWCHPIINCATLPLQTVIKSKDVFILGHLGFWDFPNYVHINPFLSQPEDPSLPYDSSYKIHLLLNILSDQIILETFLE